MRTLTWVSVIAVFAGGFSAAEAANVASPDGKVVVRLALDQGVPTWQVAFDGKVRLERGRLGMKIGGDDLGSLEEVAAEPTDHRETVKTTWGRFAAYDDHYRQLEWTLRETEGRRRKIRIIVRAYNGGAAVRYAFDAGWGESISIEDDRTEFRFAEDSTGWAYNGEHDPLGPQPLSRFHAARGARLPLTLRSPDGVHTAVLEAAIFDHAPFTLAAGDAGKLAFCAKMAPSKLAADSVTSWRVVLFGRRAGDLIVSPVLYCLNPPCRIADTSWIKPGLAMWDWRAWGAQGKDGFVYGLDMPSWRRFIDFASKHHVGYLVLDAGWYGLEFDKNSDPKTSRTYLLVQPDPQNPRLVPKDPPADWKDPIDVPTLIQYGRSKNVGIILYFNDLARQHGSFEETLALYQKWGAAGIKYGFMKGGGQQKVLETRKIVEMCAKHQLLCDFHDGPVPPSGDRRTWPNYVSREFCHAQCDARRSFSPSGFCETVFVNMLAGPLDMCNGLYTLKDPAADRPKIFQNVDTTIVAETARTMISFSGLAIIPDCPEAYEARADLFEYLGRLPMTWDETRILHGEIGQYITTARRSGRRWFIASATNEQARSLKIVLDFLPPGETYAATLYEDAPDAHYIHNREAYRVRKVTVRQGDTLQAALAPGGGHCVYLEPVPDK